MTPMAPRRILTCPACGRGHNPPPAGRNTPRLCGGCRGGFAPTWWTERTFRLPITPLVEAMGCTSWTAMERLRVYGPDWRDYLERGVSLTVADRLAVRAGLTVEEVWPDWSRQEQRHRDRLNRRRWLADLRNRGRDRAWSRRYYDQARPYVRRRQRAEYERRAGRVAA